MQHVRAHPSLLSHPRTCIYRAQIAGNGGAAFHASAWRPCPSSDSGTVQLPYGLQHLFFPIWPLEPWQRSPCPAKTSVPWYILSIMQIKYWPVTTLPFGPWLSVSTLPKSHFLSLSSLNREEKLEEQKASSRLVWLHAAVQDLRVDYIWKGKSDKKRLIYKLHSYIQAHLQCWSPEFQLD